MTRNVLDLVRISAVPLLNLLASPFERDKVNSYASRWVTGERWPAIEVRGDLVIDGLHRLAAAQLLGHAEIEILHQ